MWLKVSIDEMDQKTRMDTLIFSGVKQTQGVSVETAVKRIVSDKMGLTEIANSRIFKTR